MTMFARWVRARSPEARSPEARLPEARSARARLTRARPVGPSVIGRVLAAACVVMVIGISGGCANTEPPPISSLVPAPVTNEERVVYVALGGNESGRGGFDDAVRKPWPQMVFAGLPRSAVYVNLAARDALVQQALAVQVPAAVDLHPTLATVWFGAADANSQTSDADFSNRLTDVVRQLQAAGATRVLLLSRPASVPAGPDNRYANVIEQVARDTGSVFVAIDTGGRRGRDPEAQRQIAEAVKTQLKG
jgi:GDSL-like Lipase/Acylhydrolase family